MHPTVARLQVNKELMSRLKGKRGKKLFISYGCYLCIHGDKPMLLKNVNRWHKL